MIARYLKLASREEILITRHGRRAGVLIGLEDEEAWFVDRLENDPEFLDRVANARHQLRAGHGVRIEALRDE